MKKIIFLSLSLLTLVLFSCKKDDIAPEPIAFSQPTSASITAAAGSTVNFQARLTVTDKIDKLEVYSKIGSNPQTLISTKGFSNNTNTDVYTDTYIVPAGTPVGTVIVMTFVLYQKSSATEFSRKSITVTVN